MELQDYAERYIVDQLSTVPGVANIRIQRQQPVRDAYLARSPGAGGGQPHGRRRRTGATRPEHRAARGSGRIDESRVHGPGRARLPIRRGLRPPGRRSRRRGASGSPQRSRQDRTGTEQLPHDIPTQPRRHGRTRHRAPIQGQHPRRHRAASRSASSRSRSPCQRTSRSTRAPTARSTSRRRSARSGRPWRSPRSSS